MNIGAFEALASGARSAFVDGLIDEVYIFDRALTEAEIADLAGLMATENWHVDLVLNWDTSRWKHTPQPRSRWPLAWASWPGSALNSSYEQRSWRRPTS